MALKALLIDNTRCIGCRGCQVACKAWNNLPGEKTEFFSGPGYQNPRDLTANTWTLITYNEVEIDGRFNWVFGRKLCMHCNEPACVTACPVGALKKTADGPVVYRKNLCIGCRYCMLACPFQVPKFEWDKALPLISKCTMCADRVKVGLQPACAKVCPTRAVTFGDRDAMIHEAQRRIRSNPSRYVHHIYGRDEVGGTCVLHLSSVPFELVGYRTDLPTRSLVSYTSPAMEAIPIEVVGLAAVLGATYGIIKRRMEMTKTTTGDKEG
jgi:formate dehydrogenase iron-sulfur subunit